MAIDKSDMTVIFNAGQRLHGLNKIAEIRAGMRAVQERSQKPVREKYHPLTRKSAEEELSRFLDDMRDKHDECHDDNIRALSALFYLAGIKTVRHSIEVTEMSDDEKKALIIAMNHCRAMVSLFPKRLTLPG